MTFLRSILLLSCAILAFATSSVSAQSNALKIGVLINVPIDERGTIDIKQYHLTTARALGVKYLRLVSTVQNLNDQQIANMKSYDQAGYKVILHITNKSKAGGPAAASPENLQNYGQQIDALLNRFTPDLIAVENEELVPKFYTGSVAQYLAQLKVACDVAHAHHVVCADGGVTTAHLLTYMDYSNRGMTDKAASFAQRGIPPWIKNINNALKRPKFQEQLAASNQLIAGLAASNVDYVNIHWYIQDPQALDETVAYMRQATGKPVITTEIGQYDTSPEWVTSVMQEAIKLQMPYIIWYSGDDIRAKALQDDKGNLRPNGVAFKAFTR